MVPNLDLIHPNLSRTKLRWGILGFGRHAERVMLPALEESGVAALRAIATSSKEKAARLHRDHPELEIYDSYAALLTDKSVDVIYIGLPNHLHAKWVLRCLEQNLHVLCDKPLAVNTAEAVKIKAAAQNSSAKYFEGFMYRFHPQHAAVKQLLAAGEIGEVRLFEAHFHFSIDDFENIRLQPACGGGGLLDVGCYTVDSARFILGVLPERISAVWHLGDKSGVDEFASLSLQYAGGIAAHLTCGCRFGRSNQYTVYGSKGTINVPSAYTIPRNKPAQIEIHRSGEKPETRKIPAANHFAIEIKSFTDWITGGRYDPDQFGDGIENAIILDGARKAARSGKMVRLNPRSD